MFSMVVAFVLGHLLSTCANNNAYHKFVYGLPAKWLGRWPVLAGLTVTKRTSFPSEWFSALNADRRYVVLHLTDGRRLFGWPYEWPDHPDGGHFVLVQPEWILEENERAPLYNVERMLVPATEVKFVDILKLNVEITATPGEEKSVQDRLITYNREIESRSADSDQAADSLTATISTGAPNDGKQVPATTPPA